MGQSPTVLGLIKLDLNLLKKLKIAIRDLREEPPDETVSDFLEYEELAKTVALPLKSEGDRLWVAMSEPLNYGRIADLQDLTGMFVEPVFAKEEDILYFIDQVYSGRNIEKISAGFIDDEGHGKSIDFASDSVVAQIIDKLLDSAILNRASDVHIEPYEHSVQVRFRIDGKLEFMQNINKNMHANIISRLKVMGDMNISERRLPQDGNASKTFGKENVDLRFSTIPTLYGEKMVIRLLFSKGMRLNLEEMGFFAEDVQNINKMFERSYGAIIVTGPTGSGKTTTLTAFLANLNKPDVNIVTVEEPVENPLDGVNHIAVNEKLNLTFSLALKHILRQDPDIIMVGEIRDAETAQIATQAAITGHLVLSTLHTNDVSSVFPRLVDIGTEAFMVAAALNGVIAQRLARRLCPFCKQEANPSEHEAKLLNLPKTMRVFVPKGCNQCKQQGYSGRFAIYEYIIIDEEMRRNMILERYDLAAVTQEIRRQASSMMTNAVKNIELGNTSAEEALRVIFRG
ncbi:MAG: GspE/PulE family protein [Turicibacter sp.]|nr:GspE/PulE family protein [Turicibacter sp.]